MQVEVEVLTDQIREFLIQRGIDLLSDSDEAFNNETNVSFMAHLHVMVVTLGGDLSTQGRMAVDETLQASGHTQVPWQEAADHFFGGEQHISLEVEANRANAIELFEVVMAGILVILDEIAPDLHHLDNSEQLLVLELANVLILQSKGVDISTYREGTWIRMMNLGLDHEPWVSLIEIVFM